jgi:hypothetical protein
MFIDVLDFKWTNNRLSGKVIAANRLVTAFSMSAKSPMRSSSTEK